MDRPDHGKEKSSEIPVYCSGNRTKPRGIPRRAVVTHVLIVVFALLLMLGILLPALANIRRKASRAACASNLSRIGMAMIRYSSDYDAQFPRSGGKNSRWGKQIQSWMGPNRFHAFALAADGTGGLGSISSCFYLLIKYDYLTPESFICPGDSGSKVFIAADAGAGDRQLSDLWDFGSSPSEHCSYSYHQPFSLYPLTTSSDPGMAIAADMNPFIWSPRRQPKDPSFFNPESTREAVRMGNAYQHENDGQNVLFVDSHVSFEKIPYCGVHDDNIYTYWDGGDIRRGAQPLPVSTPQDELDSLLVNDGY